MWKLKLEGVLDTEIGFFGEWEEGRGEGVILLFFEYFSVIWFFLI